MSNHTPTPVPSEVAEATAGEREAWRCDTCGSDSHDTSVCDPDPQSLTIPEGPGRWMTDEDLAALLDRERREVGERIAEAIATSVSPGFGLNHDGSEDSHAMAYVEGLKDAHDIARDEAAR